MVKKKVETSAKGNPSSRDYGILLKPLITEKTALLGVGGTASTVAFEVRPSATKADIRGAVERIFQVDVAKVRTCNFAGKLKRTTRSVGRTKKRKKAFVPLQGDQTIDVVEGI